jgi:hypothetical protein
MSKDSKINLRLEVFKDRNSGKLSITAHFNHNAPNVYRDKDGYIWMPTEEETELLNEAFDLIPTDTPAAHSPKDNLPKWGEDKKIIPTPKPETKTEQEKYVEAPPPLNREPTVFKANANSIRTEEFVKDVNLPHKDIQDKPYEHERKEQPKFDEKETEKTQEDEGFIVEADENAINAALKKHVEKDDKSFVEADEQTIIEKVLSQKKKGKWSRK